MNAILNLPALFNAAALRGLSAPLLVVMILAMMVVPLPPFMLDLLFTFNIALAIMVLMVSLYTVKPLDFSAFPIVLLITTLLRLSLNVASTRVVLLEGHTGPDAAGKVIEAFGHFLVGGNYAVGIVVFVILVVINFVVITKGAGRIAEVSARFTLDAMPGKQMAIDADLNAGLIAEDEARRRRSEIAQEADFYGAMDGASKFVRGDAVAGIVIMLINLIGGLVVGMLQHDLDIATAARNYTLLTTGDGLVAQIPALIISTAAGMVVSRVATGQSISTQLTGQLLGNPSVLFLTAGILGVMGLLPGMPHLAFLLLAAVLAGAAYAVSKRIALQGKKLAQPAEAGVVTEHEATSSLEASWDDVAPVDVLGLEVGYRLIPLVDKNQDGELLRRIRGIRKKFAQDIGFLPPVVHIRDNLELLPSSYRITLKGVEIGSGESHPGMFLAINPGRGAGGAGGAGGAVVALPGTVTQDPAFGLPAVWIESHQRDMAQASGYTVVDAGVVVATHLNHLIMTHAAEILGRQETQQLLDHLGKESPKSVEEVIPKLLPLATLQRVLQNLLTEGVPIRDMRSIIDALSEHAARTQDARELTERVRVDLGRVIVQQLFAAARELEVIALHTDLERLLLQAVEAGNPANAGIEPGLAEALLKETTAATDRQEQAGRPAVLLVPAALRTMLARFLRRAIPRLRVVAHNEVPDTRSIKVTALIGGKV